MQENEKIIRVRKEGAQPIRTRRIWQYDKGHVLVFEDFGLPETFQVHFAQSADGEARPWVGQNDTCRLPDAYTQSSGTVYAWVYVADLETGLTKCQIEIPVESRGENMDEEPTPVQDSALDQAIAALNDGVTRAEAAQAAAEGAQAGAERYAESAGDSAITAGDAARAAAASETAAAGSASAAATSAQDALASREGADQSATAAGVSERAAKASETAAAGSASAAAGSATAAAGSASQAAGYASTAMDNARAAAGSATAADTSARAAAGSAADSQQSAQAAAAIAQGAAASAAAADGSATEAAGSASQAAGSASAAAGSATTAATSAQEAAQIAAGIETAGAAQVAAVEAKGAEVIGSIPADYSELSGDVNSLKSALDTIGQAVTQHIQTATNSNAYYLNIETLSTEKKYLLVVTVNTTGSYTIQLGTGGSASAMVDMLATNQHFTAGEAVAFYGYTPSVSGIGKIRISSNTITWTVDVYEILAISDVYDALNTGFSGVNAEIDGINTEVSDLLDDVIIKEAVTLSVQTNGYYGNDGVFVSGTGRRYAIVNDVIAGDTYSLDTHLGTVNISAILYYNSTAFLSKEKTGSGTAETVTDYMFTIPSGCNKVIVQSATAAAPVLYKYTNEGKVPKFYTKAESDARYEINDDGINGYGVKWQVSNNDDLGSRCGKAVGLNASIGIGSTNGASDFDAIYPWSEMKRCNIITNANGAKIVVYEGETGFALDGSNGDVFVRIPKFTITKEIKNGYEYHIIGVPGAPVHEAFVEKGKELDEIFVGAFEGFMDNGVLHSYGGKIPTANLTGAQYLTAARTNGCSLYDMRCVDAIWNLMAVEFGCRNTNHYIGYGFADFYQAVSNGIVVYEAATNTNAIKVCRYNGGILTSALKSYLLPGTTLTICDTNQDNVVGVRKIVSVSDATDHNVITISGDPVTVNTSCFVGSGGCVTNFCETSTNPLSWHTGRPNFVNNSALQNPIRYRWIENIMGSLWHHLPDVTFHNLQPYICKNMEDYEFGKYTGEYKPYGSVLIVNSDNGDKSDVVNENYWITSLVHDTFAKAFAFGNAYDKGLTSKKAFGGYYYLYNLDAVHIVNGGGFDHAYRCNPLTQRAWSLNDSKWYLYGARLMYKHLV